MLARVRVNEVLGRRGYEAERRENRREGEEGVSREGERKEEERKEDGKEGGRSMV